MKTTPAAKQIAQLEKRIAKHRAIINAFLMEGRSTGMAMVIANHPHPALLAASKRIARLVMKYGNFNF